MNVHFFTNHKELRSKLADAIEKNKQRLFPPENLAELNVLEKGGTMVSQVWVEP
jgi:hypothetical protein